MNRVGGIDDGRKRDDEVAGLNRVKFPLKGSPLPKQKTFFDAKTKYVAYGGARGGGKSWALRRKLVLMCLKYPNFSALLVRRTYPELRENHIRPLQNELFGLAKYTESRKCFDFPNGSFLKMGYCADEQDVLQYQGQEYDVIALDEATQFTEYQFETLKGALRGANDYPKRIYLTCNPGGVGHAWVKRLFIDRDYRSGEKKEDYTFIPAKVFDNRILLKYNPDYLEQLKSLPPGLRDAWLNGKWDDFEGQYFSEFDYDLHTVPPYSLEGISCTKYCAIDYGLDMLAALFIAVFPNGEAVVYDEVTKPNQIVSDAAKLILEKSSGVSQFIAPSDLWSRQKDSGKSIAELFGENGVWLTKINTGRIEGWLCLKEWLKPNRTEDGMVAAKLRIMRSCPDLIRCMPLLMHDKIRAGDVSTTPHSITHAPDALRYFAVTRPVTPRLPALKDAERLSEKIKKRQKAIKRYQR